MSKLIIRRETPADYAIVENLTREAFWNVNVPGCDEHYLLHCLRCHPDVIPELCLVAELDGKIVGHVLYSRSTLTDKAGCVRNILTFGPISVHPAHQRKGIGKALLEHSFPIAKALGYEVIVIFGSPANYVARGFRSGRVYNVSCYGGFPTALLVKELVPGTFDGRLWAYAESPAYDIDLTGAEAFDAQFPPKEKGYLPSQDEFYIYSHSQVVRE